MSTEFYAKKINEPEETMWVKPQRLFIGTRSGGWCFALESSIIPSLDEWIKIFYDPEVEIVSVYGDVLTPEAMLQEIAYIKPIDVHRTRDWYEHNGAIEGPGGLARRPIGRTCIGHGAQGRGTYDLVEGTC